LGRWDSDGGWWNWCLEWTGEEWGTAASAWVKSLEILYCTAARVEERMYVLAWFCEEERFVRPATVMD
jgi:hypothetical protein